LFGRIHVGRLLPASLVGPAGFARLRALQVLATDKILNFIDDFMIGVSAASSA